MRPTRQFFYQNKQIEYHHHIPHGISLQIIIEKDIYTCTGDP